MSGMLDEVEKRVESKSPVTMKKQGENVPTQTNFMIYKKYGI